MAWRIQGWHVVCGIRFLRKLMSSEALFKAQISEAKWKLSIDQTNLSKAVIRSPINGVVLKRQVEPGQTVAASLQTPVLFTIAESLRKWKSRSTSMRRM
jgi:HlyD family secretion protein